jgi:predicted transglutaminase-like protease
MVISTTIIMTVLSVGSIIQPSSYEHKCIIKDTFDMIYGIRYRAEPTSNNIIIVVCFLWNCHGYFHS